MSDKTDHREIREAIKKLPENTKERHAWETLGLDIERDKHGKVVSVKERLSRVAFRDLWLEERIPKPEEPEEKKNNSHQPKPTEKK